jgi:hypothetical protein
MELWLSLFITLTLLSSLVFFVSAWLDLNSVEQKIDLFRRNYDSERYVSLKSLDEKEDFDKKIVKSMNALQRVAEDKYSDEDEDLGLVEIEEKLENGSEEDDFDRDLINSLRYLEEKSMKEELSDEEKELVRQASFSILRFNPVKDA